MKGNRGEDEEDTFREIEGRIEGKELKKILFLEAEKENNSKIHN